MAVRPLGLMAVLVRGPTVVPSLGLTAVLVRGPTVVPSLEQVGGGPSRR